MKKVKIFFMKRAILKNIARGLRSSTVKLEDNWDDDKIITVLSTAIANDRIYEIRRQNGFMKEIPEYSKNYQEYKKLIQTLKICDQ